MGKNSSAFVNFVEKMCIFYDVDVLKGAAPTNEKRRKINFYTFLFSFVGATLHVGILLFGVKVEVG